jgi:hypothetical protein
VKVWPYDTKTLGLRSTVSGAQSLRFFTIPACMNRQVLLLHALSAPLIVVMSVD